MPQLGQQYASRFPIGPGPTACDPARSPGPGRANRSGCNPRPGVIEVARPTEPGVADNPRASRCGLWLGATRAGLIEYRTEPDVGVHRPHRCRPAFAGQWLGEQLVAGVDVLGRGHTCARADRPQCAAAANPRWYRTCLPAGCPASQADPI